MTEMELALMRYAGEELRDVPHRSLARRIEEYDTAATRGWRQERRSELRRMFPVLQRRKLPSNPSGILEGEIRRVETVTARAILYIQTSEWNRSPSMKQSG